MYKVTTSYWQGCSCHGEEIRDTREFSSVEAAYRYYAKESRNKKHTVVIERIVEIPVWPENSPKYQQIKTEVDSELDKKELELKKQREEQERKRLLQAQEERKKMFETLKKEFE